MKDTDIRCDHADACDLEGDECDHWDWHERIIENEGHGRADIDFCSPHGCVSADHSEVVCRSK